MFNLNDQKEELITTKKEKQENDTMESDIKNQIQLLKVIFYFKIFFK